MATSWNKREQFLIKNSLGGGGMASLNVDPQGKAYAQQLLEYPIPVTKELFDIFKKNKDKYENTQN